MNCKCEQKIVSRYFLPTNFVKLRKKTAATLFSALNWCLFSFEMKSWKIWTFYAWPNINLHHYFFFTKLKLSKILTVIFFEIFFSINFYYRRKKKDFFSSNFSSDFVEKKKLFRVEILYTHKREIPTFSALFSLFPICKKCTFRVKWQSRRESKILTSVKHGAVNLECASRRRIEKEV